jgi:uncharacterized protein YabE (DUF348 family)
VPVDYWTQTIESTSLKPGERRIIRAGSHGVQRVRDRVKYLNGVEIKRVRSWEEMVREPAAEQVAVGVKE